MKGYFTFLSMLIFTFLYTYYVGAKTSMLILYMFLISVPLSFFITWPLRKHLHVEIEIPSIEVEKDCVVKINGSIRNRSFMPIPFVMVDLLDANNLTPIGLPNKNLSFAPFEEKSFTIKYRALCRGTAKVGIKRLILKDFLGFFSFSLIGKFDLQEYCQFITILPRVSEMQPVAKIIQSDKNANTINSRNTTSLGFNSWSGYPGYEFREYQAGDPLHQIHWKLSAKIEKILVRKNEGGGTTKKRLILDPYLFEIEGKQKKPQPLFRLPGRHIPLQQSFHKQMAIEEKLLEAVLSVASMVIRSGRSVELWIYELNRWKAINLYYKKDIIDLQHQLVHYRFASLSSPNIIERLPWSSILMNENMNRNFKGCEAMLFTGCYDNLLQDAMNHFIRCGMGLDLIAIGDTAEAQHEILNKEDLNKSELMHLWVLRPEDDLKEAVC